MRSTEIDRRRFLAMMAAYGGAGLAAPLNAWGAGASDMPSAVADAARDAPLYLAARKNAGKFEATVIDEAGQDQLIIPLPDRGHSFAIDAPRGRAVAFGRQPGFFAVAFDIKGKQATHTLQPADNRHFFGHGVFSPDGNFMVATENDYEAGHGVLGVYDASRGGNYRRVGEFLTHGVGPHEVVLMPDRRTLCVANGGILTHPDYGKLQLNADTMQPSLAYIDIVSGELLEQVFLPAQWNRLSIRHLVVDGQGAVWFGCQHTGPAQERPPLVGRHRLGAQAELFSGSQEALRSMKNYVGSLACNEAGTVVATSSPVGGQVLFWATDSGRCLNAAPIFDGCGIAAASGNGFLVTSGRGTVEQRSVEGGQLALRAGAPDLAWDNHLRQAG